MAIIFHVQGTPVPKGSTRAFLHNKSQKIITRQDNADKQKPWASAIGYAAMQAGLQPRPGVAVRLDVHFVMPYLKSHYGTGKNAGIVKAGAPLMHIVKPDRDKLLRCVQDALTGIAWQDDSQVSAGETTKMYGPNPGAVITITYLSLSGVEL